jgi:membrane dipeptidase
MLIVDAHLDLAYNACIRGRDVTLPASEQPVVDKEIATVGLPDLARGGVGLICATIFCPPGSYKRRGYTTPDEARAIALEQLNWYRKLHDEGRMNFVTGADELPKSDEDPRGPLRAILLMEGADAMRSPADVAEWFDYGLRIVGLSWRKNRLAGGTGFPGPLTDEGRALVRALDQAGIIHDASHLAEESFWELLDLASGPVMASHSNCRAIVPGDRQLGDEMIRAIGKRNGVIGVVFYDEFTLPPEIYKKRHMVLSDLIEHIKHMADVMGTTRQIAIGTDMDGGVGRNDIPAELTTSADLPRLADALADANFSDQDIRGIMSENWLEFFGRALPKS